MTDDLRERLEKTDPDYFEWIYEVGRLPHARVIIWWQALKIAAEQTSKQGNL